MLGRLVALIVVTMLLGAWPANAEDVRPILERMLAQHKRLAAAEADTRASKASESKAFGAWFPDVKLTGDTGYGYHRKGDLQGDGSMPEKLAGISLTQTVWDFGKTDAEVEKAKLASRQSDLARDGVRQDLLLEGLSAYINLLRAYRQFDFAAQSAANVRKQTGLEQSRVEFGAGVPTDVLQAKSQLAGAEARLSRARGALVVAVNRYRTVFAEEPPAQADLVQLELPTSLPPSLEEAVKIARVSNPQLQSGRLGVDVARFEVQRVTGNELRPKLSAIAEARAGHNIAATRGVEQDNTVKLELTYPFNLGLANFRSLDAARESVTAADNRAGDALDTVEEQVRNAWQNLLTATESAEHLDNQARIAAQFLRLAQEERQHGKRTLLEVLAGETSLINAQSDVASAQADMAIASFSLLKSIGELSLNVIR